MKRARASVLLLLLSVLPAKSDFAAGLAAYVKGDYATAIKEFSLLAEQGDAKAQSSLGALYLSGRGVRQDTQEAIKWLRLAAAQGDVKAQHNLGILYQSGNGVPQDYTEAVKWYRLAAEQGFAPAQTNLGGRSTFRCVEPDLASEQTHPLADRDRRWVRRRDDGCDRFGIDKRAEKLIGRLRHGEPVNIEQRRCRIADERRSEVTGVENPVADRDHPGRQ